MFTQLPRELRDMIWSAAAAFQYQEAMSIAHLHCIIKRPLKSSCDERLRQVVFGHDNLPHDAEIQPLRAYIYNTPNRDKMRIGVNEFWTLVNCLSIATVCSEARSHAVDFCRAQVKSMNLFYIIKERSDIGEEIPEPIFVQPSTVIVTKARYIEDPNSFTSAEEFVNVITRVFGRCVERISLKPRSDPIDSLERFYWPHTTQTLNLKKITPACIPSPNYDKPTVIMTPERTVYTEEELYREAGLDMHQLCWHLLKFYEILDASAEKLPRLQSIELEMQMNCWDDVDTCKGNKQRWCPAG